MRRLTLALLALWLVVPSWAQARVEFVVLLEGDGFDDPTPVRAVGGNPGTTRGEQRRRVLERALEIWSDALDSDVPVVVQAAFVDGGCSERGAMVGGATATGWSQVPGDSKGWLYPMALADRLAGYDLAPDEPDLFIQFNGSLDHAPCSETVGPLYYGIDGAGGSSDLLATALHELAHGLGFSAFVDLSTGASRVQGGIDVFSAHIRDLELDRTWDQLTDAQRAKSATNVRRLAFDGPLTQQATMARLERGTPRISLSPPIPGFTGSIADFPSTPIGGPIAGPVALASPLDGCRPLAGDLRGKLLVIEPQAGCLRGAIAAARAGGAVGLLLITDEFDAPAMPVGGARLDVGMPLLTIGQGDAATLARAIERQTIVATVSLDTTRLHGTDERGRPLLFASAPIARGSSVNHFEPLAHPDLLMEPYTHEKTNLDLDLTVSVFHDLGWAPLCGNGKVDRFEECDEGAANRDAPESSCRRNCTRHRCGDGILDPGEQCDRGSANSDRQAGACRSDCQAARCGDGIVDPGEQCDGSSSEGCTPDCRKPGIQPWADDPSWSSVVRGSPVTTATSEDDSGCRTHGRSSAGSSLLSALLGLTVLFARRRRAAQR